MNALQLATLAAIWGASFLFIRMGAPEAGVVPLIALRVTRVERQPITHEPPGTNDAPEHALRSGPRATKNEIGRRRDEVNSGRSPRPRGGFSGGIP